MSRLARDVRGNALMLMGASLIPLAGMVGGGIDIARMYILKTRLQHACDAGALAGRRAMGGGTWGFNNNYANKQAEQFFAGNFENGSFGSYATAKQFTEDAGKVSGRASATIPMTLTRVIGFKADQQIEVTCESEMRLPNTDVMFVLDTTGSMGDTPAGDSMPKIESLKVAVKCFYEIVARLDTDAQCTTGTPSGGTSDQVQIRFGFVPYATNVNVGRLLNPDWFADTAPYQTREAVYADGSPSITAIEYRSKDPRNTWTVSSDWAGVSSSWCDAQGVPATSTFQPVYAEGNPVEFGGAPPVKTWATYQYGYYYEYRRVYDSGARRCQIQRSPVFSDMRRTYTTVRGFSQWRYAQLPVNVGLLKNNGAWKSSFEWPIGSRGTNRTIRWDGCVEERQTVSRSSYSPIPSDAKDLDIDSKPVSGDVTTQWRPVLPGLIYTRANQYGWTTDEILSPNDMGSDDYYACPRESKKLQPWPIASDFGDYVDGLYAEGNTYHDIGLIWGGRLLSPTGLFAADNATTPQGGEIERHMIFMTDGDPCTGINNYTAYGVNWFDRRTTGNAPTDGCTTSGSLTTQVNARTEALCSAIKNKNITLWVITFGYVDPRTVTRMTNCASASRYFTANNAAQLQATFKSIADQISMLRLTQ